VLVPLLLGHLALSSVQEWLTSLGSNALASWVGNRATSRSAALIGKEPDDHARHTALVTLLAAMAAQDRQIADDLDTFVQQIDALPRALASLRGEIQAQTALLHRLANELCDREHVRVQQHTDLLTTVQTEVDRLLAAQAQW